MHHLFTWTVNTVCAVLTHHLTVLTRCLTCCHMTVIVSGSPLQEAHHHRLPGCGHHPGSRDGHQHRGRIITCHTPGQQPRQHSFVTCWSSLPSGHSGLKLLSNNVILLWDVGYEYRKLSDKVVGGRNGAMAYEACTPGNFSSTFYYWKFMDNQRPTRL